MPCSYQCSTREVPLQRHRSAVVIPVQYHCSTSTAPMKYQCGAKQSRIPMQYTVVLPEAHMQYQHSTVAVLLRSPGHRMSCNSEPRAPMFGPKSDKSGFGPPMDDPNHQSSTSSEDVLSSCPPGHSQGLLSGAPAWSATSQFGMLSFNARAVHAHSVCVIVVVWPTRPERVRAPRHTARCRASRLQSDPRGRWGAERHTCAHARARADEERLSAEAARRCGNGRAQAGAAVWRPLPSATVAFFVTLPVAAGAFSAPLPAPR